MSTAEQPFTTNILPPRQGDPNIDGSYEDLLPATRRCKEHDIFPFELTQELLDRELVPNNIERMQRWLWLAGLPIPPRQLHHQVVLGRKITPSERIDLHLVWTYHQSQLFLKPLPRYLLNTGFWCKYILQSPTATEANSDDALGNELSRAARGLLFSYTALISHEIDFRIAQDTGLLPADLTWPAWRRLCKEYLTNHRYAAISPRYWYGELRLSRLKTLGMCLRLDGAYSSVGSPSSYSEWISQNSAFLTTVLGYVVVALTAMQVGLGTDRLVANGVFQDVSWGMTVFSLISPLLVGAIGTVYLLFMVIGNWVRTQLFKAERFKAMGVKPSTQLGNGRGCI